MKCARVLLPFLGVFMTLCMLPALVMAHGPVPPPPNVAQGGASTSSSTASEGGFGQATPTAAPRNGGTTPTSGGTTASGSGSGPVRPVSGARRASRRGGTTARAGGGRGRGAVGRGGGRGGRTARVRKIDPAQTFWLSAINLPWKGTFLPTAASDGYEGREMSIAEAILAPNEQTEWDLKKRPTLVLVYDPSKKQHVASMARLEKDVRFVAASHYLNMIRLDVRSIRDKSHKKSFKKMPVFLVHDQAGKLQQKIEKPRTSAKLMKALMPVVATDYGRPSSILLSRMITVLARKKYLETQLVDEVKLICDPKTGKRNEKIAAKCETWQKEIDQLAAYQRVLLTPAQGRKLAAHR